MDNFCHYQMQDNEHFKSQEGGGGDGASSPATIQILDVICLASFFTRCPGVFPFKTEIPSVSKNRSENKLIKS